MLRRAVQSVCFIAWLTNVAAAQEWAEDMFTHRSHNYGTLARGAEAVYRFELENLYEEDVHIASVSSSCGCTTPTIEKATLKTFEKGAIHARFNTQSFLGSKSATINVVIDKPYYAEVTLQVTGFIRSDVVLTPGTVNFGTVKQGSESEKTVHVSYAGRDNWGLTDIRSANQNLSVRLEETHRGGGRVEYDMIIQLKGGGTAGYSHDQLTLVTNDLQNQLIPLSVLSNVEAELTVSPRLLAFGTVKPGQTVTKKIIVRGKSDFNILDVECASDQLEFNSRNKPQKLHLIPVTYTAPDASGPQKHEIVIRTDLGVVNIAANAVVEP